MFASGKEFKYYLLSEIRYRGEIQIFSIFFSNSATMSQMCEGVGGIRFFLGWWVAIPTKMGLKVQNTDFPKNY